VQQTGAHCVRRCGGLDIHVKKVGWKTLGDE
jgi:hypothetical protein